MSMVSKSSHWIFDRFAPAHARRLRKAFDDRMGSPEKPNHPEARFCWDHWHVPGQYSLLRTPAGVFFPPNLYEGFLNHLLTFASARFGCRGMTPAWLSLYTDGCEQQWHADLPHGPWAFVYSLTLPQSLRHEFKGGDTLLLQEDVLDYWRTLNTRRGVERGNLIHAIEPRFDRLTVFDPRIPHAVSPVHGTRDPLKGRLVLHGWFAEPSPFLEGALSPKQATPELNRFFEALLPESLSKLEVPPSDGNLVLKVTVLPSGQVAVRQSGVLASTLRSLDRSPRAIERVEKLPRLLLADAAKNLVFPKRSGKTQITLPILWKSS